jgi:hypothetical protein
VPAQRAHGSHPPRHASLTVALTRQRNVERFDSPGAYRVPPDPNAAAASSESSVATNQDGSLAPPPPMYSLLEAVPVVSSVLVEATPIEAEIIHNGADEPREPRRRRLLILLFLAALVVASIAVGVAVWSAARNEPATSPGTSSSSAPSLWMDSDGSKCASQQETFNLCVNYTGNTSASPSCEPCIVDSWPQNPTVCSQIDNETCSALTSARCSSFCLACEWAFLDYFECKSGCALSNIDGCQGLYSGGGTPSSPSAPAPAASTPTPPAPSPTAPSSPTSSKCPGENAAFVQCVVGNQGNIDDCIACIDNYVPGGLSCTQYASYMCNEISACPSCGPCAVEDLAWTNCLFAGECNTFTCPGVTPSPTPVPTTQPCDSELQAWASCIESNGDLDLCSSCFSTYLPDSSLTCEEGHQIDCALAQACPDCGGTSCQDELLTFSSCLKADQCSTYTSCSAPAPSSPSGPSPVPSTPTP